MDYFEIGQRIRKYRKAVGMSQEELASAVGISTTHMSHIETGNTKLSLQVLVAIAEALNVSTDSLIYEMPQLNKTALAKEVVDIIDSSSSREAIILKDVMREVKVILGKHL